MENLRSIILSLKPGEVQLVRDFYQVKTQKHNCKRLELFELVLGAVVDSDYQAALLIYNRQPDSAFSQLKRRLKEDILNFLMACPSEKVFQSAAVQAELSARKMYIQGGILLSRGVYDEAVSLLKKALRIAEKYELTTLQIEVTDTLRSHSGAKDGLEQLTTYGQNLDQCLHVQGQLMQAKTLNYQLAAPKQQLGDVTVGAIDSAADQLHQLKESFQHTQSAKVGFWYYQSAIQYHLGIRDYLQAYQLGNELLQLVIDRPAIHSQANVASIHMELSRILIHLGRYTNAIEHANRARSMFKSGMLNELHALEALFYGSFRSHDYTNAASIIKKAQQHQHYKSVDWMPSKWQYLKAWLCFAQKRFSESLHTLQQINTYRKGHSTWALGLKLLEMLNIIEQGEYDWFENKVENFRKQLQPDGQPVNTRCKVIYKIFNTLTRTSFDYKHTVTIEESNLRSLNEGQGLLYWDPMGYELIPVNLWIQKKVD